MADTSRLGRYQIRREIARSNDIVYEATDTLIGRKVALKELALPPNLVGQPKRDRVERFYREARAAGALTHRNIVTVFEVGEDHGRHFIAMEFLDGQTLRQLLDTVGVLPVARVREILLQVLDALGYAHLNGVVHRDIKPDNIYLLPDGSSKLTDFGIARIMDEPSLTSAGQVFGTPSYMSPEQITGKDADERTDLYSVAVMAFEMLAGRKPFVGENVVALTYQIVHVDPDPPQGIPPDLFVFLRKGMAKEPSARFQSAQQMADALKPSPDLSGIAFNPQTTVPPGSGAAYGTGNFFPPGYSLPGTLPGSLQGSIPGSWPGGGTVYQRPSPLSRMGATLQRLSARAEFRQFLMAMAAGLLLGVVVVGATLGVRNAYRSYVTQATERQNLSSYTAAANDYNAKRYQDAIRKFQMVAVRAKGTPLALKANDAVVKSYLQLGDSQVDVNPTYAKYYYEQATKANPKDAESHLRLGDVYERLNYMDAAIHQWDLVIQIDGFGELGMKARKLQSILFYNRGVWESNVGDRNGAINYWQKAINADPGSDMAMKADDMIRRMSPPPFPGY